MPPGTSAGNPLQAPERPTRPVGATLLVAFAFFVRAGASSLLAAARPQEPQSAQPQQPPNTSPAPRVPENPVQSAGKARLAVAITDENGVAVASARVVLDRGEGTEAVESRTDVLGRCAFENLEAGAYRLRVEREGFYAVVKEGIRAGETESLDVTLNHQQEYRETVEVVATPPAIDPAKTDASEQLTSREIVELPYTVSRDIRYALPMLPGVVQDVYSQVHFDGSSTRQIRDQLDGFNITDPVSGLFDVRVSVDALRSVDVETSRYAPQYGKSSGGILGLSTGMGDDHFRLTGTDLPPSFQTTKRLHLNTWTPRVTLSGPLRRGKAWFLDAADGEYDDDIVPELPAGSDFNTVTRYSNLLKSQVNLSPSNIFTASFLSNAVHSPHLGLTRFDPVETTLSENDTVDFLAVRDQKYFSGGALAEAGFAHTSFRNEFHPQGIAPYVLTPDGTQGNFFESAAGSAGRSEFLASVILPPALRYGRHAVKFGVDAERIEESQSFTRRGFTIKREDGTVSRQITFLGNPAFAERNTELGAYAQDHWAAGRRLTLDYGFRSDGDQILRRYLPSPRVAGSYLLTWHGETRLFAGIGQYYDGTNLQFITSSLTGQRMDQFYTESSPGVVVAAGSPVETSFAVNERSLKEPRFTNWSAGVERNVARATTVKLEYTQKRGHNGWAYFNLPPAQPGALSGMYELENIRRDRYDAVALNVRQRFVRDHVVFASYVRSSARSSAVLNFNLENPLFSQQAGGPLPFDTPNRFISWGWVPSFKGIDVAYWLEWRSGFPFNLVDQNRELVGAPDSMRFPTYFSLNAALERRLALFGFQWALRAGFDDITDRHNPSAVDNNVNSPQFLTFGGFQTRALTGRVRLLGRK